MIRTIDLKSDEGIEARIGGEGRTQCGPFDGDRNGIRLKSIDDSGNLALAAQSTGWSGAALTAGFNAQLEF